MAFGIFNKFLGIIRKSRMIFQEVWFPTHVSPIFKKCRRRTKYNVFLIRILKSGALKIIYKNFVHYTRISPTGKNNWVFEN